MTETYEYELYSDSDEDGDSYCEDCDDDDNYDEIDDSNNAGHVPRGNGDDDGDWNETSSSDKRRKTKEHPYVCIAVSVLIAFIFFLSTLPRKWENDAFALFPKRAIWHFELYRLLSHHLFHLGPEHIGANLVLIFIEGVALEKSVGSFNFLIVTLWSALLTSSIFCILCYILDKKWEHPDEEEYYWCMMDVQGFSGIIFHWCVWACAIYPRRRFDFDFIQEIPAPLFPWVCLVGLYFYDPENDGGHLFHFSGMLCGYLHAWGYLDWLLPMALERRRLPPNGKSIENGADGSSASTSVKPTELDDEPEMTSDELRALRLKKFNAEDKLLPEKEKMRAARLKKLK